MLVTVAKLKRKHVVSASRRVFTMLSLLETYAESLRIQFSGEIIWANHGTVKGLSMGDNRVTSKTPLE